MANIFILVKYPCFRFFLQKIYYIYISGVKSKGKNLWLILCCAWAFLLFYHYFLGHLMPQAFVVCVPSAFPILLNAFFVQEGVVIRPITFRSDWSYFMNFWVIGLIKVVPASKFRSDWSYKSQIRKNDLLQKLENLT